MPQKQHVAETMTFTVISYGLKFGLMPAGYLHLQGHVEADT